MNLQSKRILLTGAAGGIGRQLCTLFAAHNARLCLVDRDQQAVESVGRDMSSETLAIAADITNADDRAAVIVKMEQAFGGIDILINLAGILDFKRFQDSDPATIQRILQVNVEAPMQLIRAVLPKLTAQGSGRIVNIGSMFGSIGFPGFAVYSASKFALRGFSQALRRELTGTGVGVTYISPRAVKTPLNPEVVYLMAERGMMRMDDAQWVAAEIVHAIEKEKNEAYLGFPEKLFARINAILPGVVDQGIAKQVPEILAFAQRNR
ncbi:MAG: SDR family oxidoreductase [Gammaproteobacteria bacterium]|nr:SDR family oxidoreductase [Gammaproteobacteria bacterium]